MPNPSSNPRRRAGGNANPSSPVPVLVPVKAGARAGALLWRVHNRAVPRRYHNAPAAGPASRCRRCARLSKHPRRSSLTYGCPSNLSGGVRYRPDAIGGGLSAAICPPYDMIDGVLKAQLQQRSPYNAVHLEGGEQPDPIDPAAGYQEAAARFPAVANRRRPATGRMRRLST